VVNVAHQLGNSLGLAVLVSLAAAGAHGLSGAMLLAHRVTSALTASAVFLMLALLLMVRLQRAPATVS
jgi:hypothetical protein